MEINRIDDRAWVRLAIDATPLGSVVELAPEDDRVLRPVDMLTLSSMEGNHLLQAKGLVDAQASTWTATMMDGKFSNTVDFGQPGRDPAARHHSRRRASRRP